MTTEQEAAVTEALEAVLDPCSCFTQDPVNVVDLGLIEEIEVEAGTVRVEVLPTSPGCTYLPYIESDIEDRVSALPFVNQVRVEQVTDQIWTRERMDEATLDGRIGRLRTRLSEAGLEPHYDTAVEGLADVAPSR